MAVAGQTEALPVGADIELQMKLLRACAATDAGRVPAHIAVPLAIKHVEIMDEAALEAHARSYEQYAEAIFKPLLESILGFDYRVLRRQAMENLAMRIRGSDLHAPHPAHHSSSSSYSS